MVGVVVIGIIGGIAVATVFAVIPWSQDNAAKASLGSIGTAQAANAGQTGSYAPYSGLVNSKLISKSDKLYAFTDAQRSCYIAISQSTTGKYFYNTNLSQTPQDYTESAGMNNGCYPIVSVEEEVGANAPLTATPAGAKRVYFSQISAGNEHTMALDLEGNIWGWGLNDFGQIGNGKTGSFITEPVPIQVTTGTKFVKIEAGWQHTLALDSTGKLWSWGRNQYGQLGNGNTTTVPQPTMITPTKTYTTVKAGSGSADAAIDTSGKLWTWGINSNGQIGDGTTTNRSTPVNITPSATYKAVAMGLDSSYAIDTAGKAWGWGANYSGQVGDGTYTNRLFPVATTGTAVLNQIAAGGEHVLALDGNGKLYVWGGDPSGQLGNGVGQVNVSTPTMITPDKSYLQVTAGNSHSAALDTDRRIWTWGKNHNGQMGNGTASNTETVQVPTLFTSNAKFTGIDAGYDHTSAIDGANNTFGWGYNNSAQIGVGDRNVNKLTMQNVVVPKQ